MSNEGRRRIAGIRWLASAAAIIAGGAAIALVSWSMARSPDSRVRSVVQHLGEIQLPRAADEIKCTPASDAQPPLVLLALGQSNAGNHGEQRAHSSNGELWFAGHCYTIADPLAGATGTGGSIWSRLASELGSESNPRQLRLIVLAVTSSSIGDWVGDGPLSKRFAQLLADLQEHQINVSAVLWQQGEADARLHLPRERYVSSLIMLLEALRKGGVAAPVFLARSTRCADAISADVREGMALVAAQRANVRLGPDTDVLGSDMRSDDCHLNARGLEHAAGLWREVLLSGGVLARLPEPLRGKARPQ